MYETTPLPPKALKHYSQAPLLLICLVFFASPLLGQPCQQLPDPEWLEAQQITGTNLGDNLGATIAMNGELMVVGSPRDSTQLSEAGSAEVFRLVGGTWQLEQQLQSASPLADERFGNSVDVYDDGNGGGLVVISTRPVSLGTGLVINVYVYRMDTSQSSTWNLDTVLTPPSEPIVSGSPGSSVAVDKNYIAVGVPFGDSTWGSTLRGVVRVYEFGELVAGQWSESPGDPLSHFSWNTQLFGSWVDIQISDAPGQAADLIVIGAPASIDLGIVTGKAFVFERTGNCPTPNSCYDNHWELADELNPIDGATDLYNFGTSVAISNDVIVVGAHQYPDGPGSAHVFRLDHSTTDFAPEQILVASDGAPGDIFGRSVAISGNTIVVGAFGDTSPTLPLTPEWGAAYVYRHVLSNPPGSAWTDESKLAPLNLQQGDRFGVSVAISGCHIGVGASRDDDNGSNSGSAFVFQNADCNPCVEVQDVTMQIDTEATCTSIAQISMANLSECVLVGASIDVVYPFGPPTGAPFLPPYNGPQAPQGFLPFNTPIPQGGNIFIDVPISGALAGDCICLEITLHADTGSEYEVCCTLTICVEIPIQVECADCNDDGVPDATAILLGISNDCNGNGIPDECEGVHIPCKEYIVGDTNGDGQQNVADVITLLSHLFSGGSIACRSAGDFNDDEVLDIADVIALLNFIFAGGAPPPTGHDCTEDLTPSDLSLDCEDSSCD